MYKGNCEGTEQFHIKQLFKDKYPDSLDTSSNYQISEDNEMTGESVATQNTSDEIVNDETSVDEPVKTYTK